MRGDFGGGGGGGNEEKGGDEGIVEFIIKN